MTLLDRLRTPFAVFSARVFLSKISPCLDTIDLTTKNKRVKFITIKLAQISCLQKSHIICPIFLETTIWQFSREGAKIGRNPVLVRNYRNTHQGPAIPASQRPDVLCYSHILCGEFINNFEPGNNVDCPLIAVLIMKLCNDSFCRETIIFTF